jgi:hypothetical protein
LALASAKRAKGEDDDGDVIVMYSGPHRSAARTGARLVAVFAGRVWAERGRRAVWSAAAQPG